MAIPGKLVFRLLNGAWVDAPGERLSAGCRGTLRVAVAALVISLLSVSQTFAITLPLTAATQIGNETLTQGQAPASFTPVIGSGGAGGLTYTVFPPLPGGLTMASGTGTITGTPNGSSAATPYTVTVTDQNGATASSGFTLTVNGPVTAALVITSKSLTVNQAIPAFTPVTGSGGTAPLSYSVTPTLPSGITIVPNTGAIVGVPTTTSNPTNYIVTVTDANGASASNLFSLAVNGPVKASTAIPTTSLTQGHAATPFTPVTGSGGTSPLSYSVAPPLPANLTMASGTGTITGTPTSTQAATPYTVTVTDQNGATATANFSLAVASTVTATTAVASTVLTTNQAASFTPVTGAGGTSPLTFSVAPALPAGLTLNASSGTIRGTPTVISAAATYTVTVKDANAVTATATFSLTVRSSATTVTLTSSQNPSSSGQAVTFSATVTGGSGTPGGTVTFNDGGTVIGTAALSGGVAALTISTLKTGTHTITAAYGGNGAFGPGVSPALTQTVNVPADSVKLHTLQVNVTRVVAQGSGQAISGAIDGAIADGFAGGGALITPSGTGFHYNFAADPDEQGGGEGSAATAAGRGNLFGSMTNAYGATGAGSNNPTGQRGGRIDDAFAALDRQTPIKAPLRKYREEKDWMLWADVRGTGLDRMTSTTTAAGVTTAAAPLYGFQINALLGVTYKVRSNFLVGVFGGYETFNYTEQDINGKLTGEGWTTGAYLGWKLAPMLRYDAAVAYSGIGYDGVAGTAQGNFDGRRWMVSTGLTGSVKTMGFEIEPSARVYVLWENEGAYVDSLGTPQAGYDFSTGRASTGAKVTYPIAWNDAVGLAPFVGLYADYYFDQDNAGAIVPAGGIPLASTPLLTGWSARITGGLGVQFASGASVGVGAEYGGIGSGFEIWTFTAKARMPF